MNNLEVPQFQMANEGEIAIARYGQLQRLVTMDMVFSEGLTATNEVESGVPQDLIDALQETRDTIRVGIFHTLLELSDVPVLGERAWGMVQVGRGYQTGEIQAVTIGQNPQEVEKEIREHVIFLQGNEYEQKYIAPHNRKSD